MKRVWFAVATGLVGCVSFLVIKNVSAPEAFLTTPTDKRFTNLVETIRSAQPIAVSISPGGKSFITKSETVDGGFEVVVTDAATSRAVSTNKSFYSHRALTWRPDGKVIAFQETAGMERPLCILDVSLGSSRRLKCPISQTALPPLRWNASGTKIAYFHGNSAKGRLIVVDAVDDDHYVEIAKDLSSNCDYEWSHDTKKIAVVSASTPGAISIYSVDRPHCDTINIGNHAKIETVVWSPNDEELLATARLEQDEFFKLFRVSIGNNIVNVIAEAEGDISKPIWSRDNTLVYHVLKDGLVQALVANSSSQGSHAVGPTNGVLSISHTSPDGSVLYGRYASLQRCPELIEIRPRDGSVRILFPATTFAGITCPAPDTIKLIAKDGLDVPAYHWAAFRGTKSKTAVIEIHGGLHTQTFPTWEPWIATLVSNGVDVIAVNYRGSSGFGHMYERIGTDEERVQDIVAAYGYAVNSLGVSPRSVYLFGNSRGTSLAAAAAAEGIEIGGLVLMSWAGTPHFNTSRMTNRFDIFAFQGQLDPFVPPRKARESVKDFLNENHSTAANKRWYSFSKEGHFFYRSESWAIACWEILTCEQNQKRVY